MKKIFVYFFFLALESCQDDDAPESDCIGKASHNP